MKTTSQPRSANPVRLSRIAFALTFTVLSAVLLGGVSALAQTYTNVNWVAPSAEDYSTAAGWDLGFVPSGSSFGGVTNTYVILLTNGVTCNYASPDNDIIGQMSVAPWDNTSGNFVMSSGTLTITTNNNNYALTIPGRSGANGSGGSSVQPNSGANCTGTLTMNGGTLNVIRFGTGHYHQDALVLGLSTNSTGTIVLNSGATLNAYCGIELGFYGNGIFTINGGTLMDNGWFGIGRGNSVPFGSGTFNMEAGTFYQMENTGGGTVGGSGGIALDQGGTNANVNISGGTIYSGDISFSGPNVSPTPQNYLNMSGGNVYIGYAGVYSNSSTMTASVTISGGTFHTVDMVPTGTGAIGSEGSPTNILSDGTNWTWALNPSVNLTNSSFMVNGVSGPGFVTFAPEANRTITLNNQWGGVGGFVANGPGTVFTTSNGLQNVQGGVTVSNGTLVANGAIANPGSLTVQSGTLAMSPNTATTGIGSLIASNVTINGTMNFKLNTATTVGGGVNDLLVVSNLTIGAGSVLNVIPLSQPTLSGQYVVAQYSGTLSGNFTTVNGSANDTFSVSAQNNEILLTVTSVGSGNFDWIAPSEADWSVAGDWNEQSVPNNAAAYVVVTNSAACDYSSSDNDTVGGLFIGTNSFGTVNINGGTLTVTNAANQYSVTIGGGYPGVNGLGINEGGPGIGTLNMSGGTLNVSRNNGATFQQDGFMMGLCTGGSGTFNLSGGTANIWCGIEMGCEGAATLNVSGGALVDTGWFHVGEGLTSPSVSGNGTATFNLSGGAVYILPNNNGPTTSGINGGFTCGYNVSNVVANISGGSIYCSEITMSCAGGVCTNTLNIAGGLIYVGPGGVNSNAVAGSNAVNYVNISGGTFHTVDMLAFGKGGVLGSTNNIMSDGTNWAWSATLPVNLTNSTFAVSNGLGGTVTGPGVVTFAPEAGRTITLNNVWAGSGSMNFAGPGQVITTGNITNSSVDVSGGTFTVESPHFSVPLIIIGGGATYNLSVATIPGGIVLTSPTVISNSSSPAIINIGTVHGVNSGTVTANMTFAAGTPSWAITNGTLTLASSTVLNVNNTGLPLTAGSYPLVATNSGGVVTGTVPATFTVGGAGIAASTAASLSISNSELYLVVTSSAQPMPTFTGISVSGTTLNISATNGQDGAQYMLVGTTNLNPPVVWKPILTNNFDVNGDINLSTNILNPAVPDEFYMLEY